MTTYVLSHKLEELMEENGVEYEQGPHWRRVVTHCPNCESEQDPDTWHTCKRDDLPYGSYSVSW